jgi:hypothetical protein
MKTTKKKPTSKPKAKPPAKIGRPSSFTEGIAARICEELALGRSLVKICSAPGMPSQTSVFRWLEENLAFRERYTRARELQADTYADQIVDLADDAEDANLARLQVEARKWTASKLRPMRYGDRITQEHVGKNGGPVEIKTITSRMTPQEEAEAYAETLNASED